MTHRIRALGLALLAAAVTACSTVSTISSSQQGTVVSIQDKTLNLPAQQSLKGTSFGNYEFKATNGDAP